jgi:tetratricopeptide (TPR) repeat protein
LLFAVRAATILRLVNRRLKRTLAIGFACLMAALAAFVVWKATTRSTVPEDTPAPHWASKTEGPDADLHAAMELAQAGKCREALPALDRRVNAAPDDWMALGLRSDCYQSIGRDADALVDIRRVASRFPADGTVAVRLIKLLIKVGKKDEALALTEKLVQQSPESAEAYLVLSDFEAERDLEKSVRLIETYVALAWDGKATDGHLRETIEDPVDGTYAKRVIAKFRAGLPEGDGREARAEIEARWYIVNKYSDLAPFDHVKDKPLGHLLRYLDLAKAHGEPDQVRYAKAKDLAARFKKQVREAELLGARPDAGAEAPAP